MAPSKAVTTVSEDGDDDLPAPAELRGAQAQRRQRIIDEAHAMIAESGDETVQIRDIAERADVALGTAYRYFGSKERLFAEVYAQWCQRLHEALVRDMRRGKSNTERTRLLARTMLERLTGEPQLASIGRVLKVTEDPSILRIVHRTEHGMLQLFRDALHGVEQRDADAIAMIVMSVIRAAQDRHTWAVIDLDEANREVAKAVKMVLEFRDPALDDPGARSTSRPAKARPTSR
ncbi:MAG: TetR/AcrR family transcriptional regulator, cholesterol catabolism regulator [Actinomycetota bacterium]|jgi:AcrR family transcriptional regulator